METTDVAISSECFYEECSFFALFMERKAFAWNGIFYTPDLIPLGLGAGNFTQLRCGISRTRSIKITIAFEAESAQVGNFLNKIGAISPLT